MNDHPDTDLTDLHGEAEALRRENARLRAEIAEATDPEFIWGALDNVHDCDTTLDDYAAAVSRAQRAALAASHALTTPDATAALAARDAAMRNEGRRQVKVKPLVWHENPDIGEGGFIAKGAFDAAYHAMRDGWSDYRRGLWADANSLSAAKAAAQADYEGRILAALEPEGGDGQKG